MMPTNRRFLLDENSPGPLRQPGELNATAAPPPALVQFSSSSMVLLGFVLIVAIFFLCFFAMVARRFIFGIDADGDLHRSASAAALPRRSRGSSCAPAAWGLDAAAVRRLPVLSYVGGGGKEGCVVCLTDFEEKEKVKLIPGCGHVFHPQCIDAWLMSKGSCPICRCSGLFGSGVGRLDLVVGDGGRESGEELGVGVEVEVGAEAERGGEEEVR